MKNANCKACGAPRGSHSDVKCEYCGTLFPIEQKKETAPESTTIINNYYNTPKSAAPNARDNLDNMSKEDIDLYYSPRPKIKFWPAFIGLCLWMWPGIIYIMYKAAKQAKWDRLHGQ